MGHASELRPKGPSGQPERLAEKYNFAPPRAKAGYSGNKKLAVMSMRQEIVDAIDQNQVRSLSLSMCSLQGDRSGR